MLRLVLIFLITAWIAFLYKGAADARWAVNLVGGPPVIDSQRDILRDDSNFMRSIKIKPSKDDFSSIDKITLCTQVSVDCADKAMSKTNIITLLTGNGKPSADLLNAYLKEADYAGLGCQAKHEISRIIAETSFLLGRKDKKEKAAQLIEKIKNDGGIDFSIRNEPCRQYLSERPYLAHAYLYHLSMLLSFAQGKYSSEWMFLYYKAGFFEV